MEKGEIFVPVNLHTHWSYGARSMPRKRCVFRRQSCQCLKNLLLRKHRITKLGVSMLVKLKRIFTGLGKARNMYKGTSPMPNIQTLLQSLDFLNEISLPLISCLETVSPV